MPRKPLDNVSEPPPDRSKPGWWKIQYQRRKHKHIDGTRKWAKENPEKMKDSLAKYREKHREECRQRCRNWYLATKDSDYQKERRSKKYSTYYADNRDEILNKNREYRINNLESVKAKQRDYRNRNLESKLEACRKWYRDHRHDPERVENRRIVDRAYQLKRRALKRKSSVNLKSILKWMKSVRSKKYAICYYCKNRFQTTDIHFDHIFPLSRGGPHSVENLCVACSTCNLSKTNKPLRVWITSGQQLLEL